MDYTEMTDTYICHACKKLQPLLLKKQKETNGYTSPKAF